MAYIAFTASDLWPGEGWNFVFGQATLRDRVGVWSIQRNGDPDESPAAFQLALLRTLKIAMHEAGHMFSIAHCTAYRCLMAGTNSLEESDRAPLWLCPECMAKIAWATHADPVLRYLRLAQFCDAQGFRNEATFFRRSARVIEAQARPH
jgi:archaemetzincin